MSRYSPSRQYLLVGMLAVALAALSAWFAIEWAFALIASALFLATAGLILWLAFRPVIEVHQDHLKIGPRIIPWTDIRRVDRTGWISPLAVNLVLGGGARVVLIYPGDVESANSLLRHLRRHSREALIDGVPHRQFWGEPNLAEQHKSLPSPRYQVLRPEDEAEVERLYQVLKTVGHIDPKRSPDEK